MKKTAVAPSNIAFIKYWGKKDEALRLPSNGSISMNLSNLLTTTTVEFDDQYKKDEVVIEGSTEMRDIQKVIAHLNLIRNRANIKTYAKVMSQNNFPSSTGLSSSASGFAALTVAAAAAAGLSLNEKETSILARIGSGSACRSIPSGFVEWLDGNDSESSYAESIYPPGHWDIVDVVAVVSREKKEVSTTDGHRLASTSPFNELRLSHVSKRIAECKKILKEKKFTLFG
ncbi:diphosphomevalonate decarboxylase, partial [Candidatus Roizmanbacteria bacterium CG_4_10_14_0_8_um_filter_39_9]